MKRALIYARVSTDEQADKGYSLPSQIEACKRYTAILGYEVAEIFSDDYSGATPIAERPAGIRMALALREKQANVIVAYQVDRLSRDIVDLLASVRIWLQRGIEVHACDIGKIESELDIVLVIKGWQGSDERKRIVERTSRGRFSKAKSGRVVGSGVTPYGYTYQDDALVINEVEAQVIRWMFEWYLHGDENGKPLSEFAITRRLCEMGIRSPGVSRGLRRAHNAVMWQPSTVGRILANETYTGTLCYGKKIAHCGKGGTRPVDQVVRISIPAIVEHSTWRAAQMRKESNKRASMRNARHPYLLRGIFKCECGHSMAGQGFSHTRRRNYYYRCTATTNRFSHLESARCTAKPIRGDFIEGQVWRYVVELLEYREDFERALRTAQETQKRDTEPKVERLATVVEMIAECENEAARCAEALMKISSELIARALNEKIKEIDRRYEALRRERDNVTKQLTQQKITEEEIVSAMQFRDDVYVGMQDASGEDQRAIFGILQVRIVLEQDKARITCLIPKKVNLINLHIS